MPQPSYPPHLPFDPLHPYMLDPRYSEAISPRHAPVDDARGWFGPPSRSLPSLSPRYMLHASPRSVGAPLLDDREIRKAYERIKERQRKLEALKRGLDIDDNSDATSGGSDATNAADRKSVTSAYSYTQGVYRPDLMALYGSQRALRLGHHNEEPMNDDAEWIRQQEEEIAARLVLVLFLFIPQIDN